MIDDDEYRKRLEEESAFDARSTARMPGIVLLFGAVCAVVSTCVGVAYWAVR